MATKLSEKEKANRKAKALSDIAESFDKQGGSDPESKHRVADQIRAKAARLIERADRAGKIMKPVRVLLEKDGERWGSVVSFAEGFLPPKPLERWDDRHIVVRGQVGQGDDTWDEVILTIAEIKKGDTLILQDGRRVQIFCVSEGVVDLSPDRMVPPIQIDDLKPVPGEKNVWRLVRISSTDNV